MKIPCYIKKGDTEYRVDYLPAGDVFGRKYTLDIVSNYYNGAYIEIAKTKTVKEAKKIIEQREWSPADIWRDEE